MITMTTVPENGRMRMEVTVDGEDAEGYLYKIGERVVFHGLLVNRQFNGESATVRAYRRVEVSQYCASGRAYYFTEPTPWGDDWTYEERIKPAESDLENGLSDIREIWEKDAIVILHKESLSRGCHVTIQEIDRYGTAYIQVMRYFTLGDVWHASQDYSGLDERRAWERVLECFA